MRHGLHLTQILLYKIFIAFKPSQRRSCALNLALSIPSSCLMSYLLLDMWSVHTWALTGLHFSPMSQPLNPRVSLSKSKVSVRESSVSSVKLWMLHFSKEFTLSVLLQLKFWKVRLFIICLDQGWNMLPTTERFGLKFVSVMQNSICSS